MDNAYRQPSSKPIRELKEQLMTEDSVRHNEWDKTAPGREIAEGGLEDMLITVQAQISGLEQTIDHLTARLDPILVPERVNGDVNVAAEKAQQAEPQSVLQQSVRRSHLHLHALQCAVEDLMVRIRL